jgi:hypothetical protein
MAKARKEGKKEQRGNMVVLSVKVPPDLKAVLQELAKRYRADERDMSFWARKFLKLGLEVYNDLNGEQEPSATTGELIGRAVDTPASLKVAGKRRA